MEGQKNSLYEAKAATKVFNTPLVKADNMTKAIANLPTGIINETFPHKLCISLDRRPERWREMQRKFEQHGIHSVRRFSALDGENLKLPAKWVHPPRRLRMLTQPFAGRSRGATTRRAQRSYL